MRVRLRHVRNAANMLGAASTIAINFTLAASPALVTMQFSMMPSVVAAQALVNGANQVRNNITEYQLDPSALFWGSGPYNPSNPNADININDGSTVSTITPQALFGGDLPDNSDTTWSSAEEGAIALEAQARLTTLETEISAEGDAVRIVNNFSSIPDLWEDPMWTPTYEVVNQGEDLRPLLADCTLTTTLLPGSGGTVFLSDERTCRRVEFDTPPPTSAFHSYNFNIYTHIAGPQNILPCPGVSNCVDVFIGTVGDNYWCDGGCGYFTEFTEFQFNYPDAIISARLEQALFDDFFRVSISGSPVYIGPAGVFPADTGPGAPRCELRTSWNTAPNVDVTPQIVAAGGRLRLQTETAVSGCGEGYARVRILFDPSRIINSVWTYDVAAYNDLVALSGDGACTLNHVCTNLPTLNASGCLVGSLGLICAADFPPAPFPGIPPMCRSVDISVDCTSFTSGTLCYPDPAAPGGETCITVDITGDDACTVLEANPSCGFISRVCDPGSFVGGSCRVFTETWECGSNVAIPGGTIEEEYVCAGEIGCLGEACIVDASVDTRSFAEAVTALQAIEHLTNDLGCDPTASSSLDECEIFPSKPAECRDSFFGVYNCCDVPASVGLGEYLSLAGSTISAARAADALFFASAGRSAFNEFMSPVYDVFSSASGFANQAFTAIQQPFVQTWNSITGQTVEVAELAIGATIESFKNSLLQSVAEWTLSTFGEQATNFLFVQAGTSGGPAAVGGALGGQVALAPNVVLALNAISLAFAAYSIATLILAIVFACEEEEFSLATAKELRSTRYIGRYCSIDTPFTCLQYTQTYCQFNSPLSRIVMEQVVDQLADYDWGTPRNPICPSLLLTDIDRVDWDAIDLSEWTGILAETGIMPGLGDVDVERLTGEASTLGRALPGTRLDAIDRQEERGRNIEIDNIRRAASGGTPTNPPDITVDFEYTQIACDPVEFIGGNRFYQRRIETIVDNPNPGVTVPVTTVVEGPWLEYANDCEAACWEFAGFTSLQLVAANWTRDGTTVTRPTSSGPPNPSRWSNPLGLPTAGLSGPLPTGCGVDDDQFVCADVATGNVQSFCSSGGFTPAMCPFPVPATNPGSCSLPTPSGSFAVPPIPYPG